MNSLERCILEAIDLRGCGAGYLEIHCHIWKQGLALEKTVGDIVPEVWRLREAGFVKPSRKDRSGSWNGKWTLTNAGKAQLRS
ncbi:MAG: hypothetical protein RIQ56_126 [Candidatus Parcubacteria bacterium]|jgi:hypothetical protein